MRKKAFTLMEIVIVIIVVGILATLGMPLYQNFIEDQKAKVCEANLKAQKTALDIYMMEHDGVPGSLSYIPQRYFDQAYSLILKEKDAWKIKLAYFILELQEKSLAFAVPLANILGGRFVCPKDKNPSATHGSYGINAALVGMTAADYRKFEGLTIADCENPAFSSLNDVAKRHAHSQILGGTQLHGQGVNNNNEVCQIDRWGMVRVKKE
ncbi:MAG: prepilin-type N-terminal cleavage/methylation domain-containing protein [Candidatus Omnitrophica bacterium]|nr:prepilin-type N-terminal cleavage/methylation domain-containing protein [Candidatus Omnitrophota bacterium]